MSNASTPNANAPADARQFMSIAEFVHRSGLSRATVYRMVDRGELPRPTRLTVNRVAWPRPAAEAWFTSKLTEAAA